MELTVSKKDLDHITANNYKYIELDALYVSEVCDNNNKSLKYWFNTVDKILTIIDLDTDTAVIKYQ